MTERKITSLGEIARDPKIDISRSTLDHYNEFGLLMKPIQILGKQYLYYEDELINRINEIKRMKNNGLTLKDIKCRLESQTIDK